MALSEQNKTRPHQPRHIGIPLPLTANLGHHSLHHSLHHTLHHSSVSPSPSPSSHRRMGSSSSAGSVTFSTTSSHTSSIGGGSTIADSSIPNFSHAVRTVHERSHSDTPTPLPSVDLSAESSSVTSLSNLPLRKNITSGKTFFCFFFWFLGNSRIIFL